MKRFSKSKADKILPNQTVLAGIPIVIGGLAAYQFNPMFLAVYILTVLALCIKPE